jgi:hypothetical protein
MLGAACHLQVLLKVQEQLQMLGLRDMGMEILQQSLSISNA